MLIKNLQNVKLSVHKKDYAKIEEQSNIFINVFVYEDEMPCCIYTSKQTYVDLILFWNSKNSLYILIKDFNRFVTNQTKNGKKNFC